MNRIKIANIELSREDCLELMGRYPNKHFDLAIVDPPYGIGKDWKKNPHSQFYKHDSSYKNDVIPGKDYFDELFRVSDKQIIWGGNYYTDFLPATGAWIVWDKKRLEKQLHAQGELAWTSLRIPLRIIPFAWSGCVTCEPRYGKHPHEKPVTLYKWLLSKYAKPGMKILDIHLGSGSLAIACYDMGFELTACEIDSDYFTAAVERVRLFAAQQTFDLGAQGYTPCLFESVG